MATPSPLDDPSTLMAVAIRCVLARRRMTTWTDAMIETETTKFDCAGVACVGQLADVSSEDLKAEGVKGFLITELESKLKHGGGGGPGKSAKREQKDNEPQATVVHHKLEFPDRSSRGSIVTATTFPFRATVLDLRAHLMAGLRPVPSALVLLFEGHALLDDGILPASTPESPIVVIVRDPSTESKSHALSSISSSALAGVMQYNDFRAIHLPWSHPNPIPTPRFEWTERGEAGQSSEYIRYFTQHVAPPNLRFEVSDVRGQATLFDIPSSNLPSNIATLKGTCDFVVHPQDDVEFSTLFLIVDVKKPDNTRSSLPQFHGEMLGAELKSSVPTLGVLTDLQEDWHLAYFASKDLLSSGPLGACGASVSSSSVLYVTTLSRGEAVAAIRQYLDHMQSLYTASRSSDRLRGRPSANDENCPLLKVCKVLPGPVISHSKRFDTSSTQPPSSCSCGTDMLQHPFNPLDYMCKLDPFAHLSSDERDRLVAHAETLSPAELLQLKLRLLAHSHGA